MVPSPLVSLPGSITPPRRRLSTDGFATPRAESHFGGRCATSGSCTPHIFHREEWQREGRLPLHPSVCSRSWLRPPHLARRASRGHVVSQRHSLSGCWSEDPKGNQLHRAVKQHGIPGEPVHHAVQRTAKCDPLLLGSCQLPATGVKHAPQTHAPLQTQASQLTQVASVVPAPQAPSPQATAAPPPVQTSQAALAPEPTQGPHPAQTPRPSQAPTPMAGPLVAKTLLAHRGVVSAPGCSLALVAPSPHLKCVERGTSPSRLSETPRGGPLHPAQLTPTLSHRGKSPGCESQATGEHFRRVGHHPRSSLLGVSPGRRSTPSCRATSPSNGTPQPTPPEEAPSRRGSPLFTARLRTMDRADSVSTPMSMSARVPGEGPMLRRSLRQQGSPTPGSKKVGFPGAASTPPTFGWRSMAGAPQSAQGTPQLIARPQATDVAGSASTRCASPGSERTVTLPVSVSEGGREGLRHAPSQQGTSTPTGMGPGTASVASTPPMFGGRSAPGLPPLPGKAENNPGLRRSWMLSRRTSTLQQSRPEPRASSPKPQTESREKTKEHKQKSASRRASAPATTGATGYRRPSWQSDFAVRDQSCILCLGDSLTQGFMGGDSLALCPYSDRLLQRLGEVGHAPVVTNAGVTGEETKKIAERLPGLLHHGHKYDLVLILAGTNDLMSQAPAGAVVNSVKMLHQRAFDAGCRTVLMTIPEFFLANNPASRTTNENRLAANEALRMFASENRHRVILVDIAEYIINDAEHSQFWSSDGVHLSQKGYEMLGDLLAAS